MIPRRRRIQQLAHHSAWALLGAIDVAAWARLIPPMPHNLHTLAAAACVAGTVAYIWTRFQAPVRAAFLDGMLHERQTAASQNLPTVLPIASGDGIARVVQLNSGTGRHRPKPHPGRR